jgi:hypothetical protein
MAFKTSVGADGESLNVLAELRQLTVERSELERREAVLVRRARNEGFVWEQIASSLDVSRQAVHKKDRQRDDRALHRGFAVRRGLGRRVGDSGCVKCAGSSGSGEAEEHHERSRQPGHVVIAQLPHALPELGARDGGDLVDHQPTGLSDASGLVGFDEQSDQRCVGRISGERTDGHRSGGIEAVVLDDDDGSGLADVAAAR